MKLALLAFATYFLLPMPPTTFAQELPEPTLVSSQLPQPAAAGEVKASFVLNASGEVTSVEILSARSDLGAATNENIRSWKFKMPNDLYRTEWKYETIFRYHSREVASSEPEKLTVVFESFHRVDVTRDFHKTYPTIVDVPFHK
jgi:hypothetical protein